MTAIALTIAGSDSGGGAGIQADLKTFHQYEVYGTSVLTLVTVQDTRGIRSVLALDPEMVGRQLQAVLEDLPPAAIKTGALGSAGVVECVAAGLRNRTVPLVVDPVMSAHTGHPLMDEAARAAMTGALLPLATLVTPNVPEAEILAKMSILGEEHMAAAAAKIAALGPRHVLIKGGHLAGSIVDLLWSEGRAHFLRGPRIASVQLHGTGCVLSAAITARMARGDDVASAVAGAHTFIRRAIASAPPLGRGRGPLNLLASTSDQEDPP
jgi:hydroxymethylpyrimidine/phosphomethylpyrimidine kinase